MHFFKQSALVSGIIFTAALYAIPASGAGQGNLGVDFNEETHMIFMREEEKLARDVYITLGTKYSGTVAFSNIDDSEEQHTATVRDKLIKYNIDDPNTDDTVGEFTGADYGDYFTGKYKFLVQWGKKSLLDALYVGAYIEEFGMLEAVHCPKIIIETHDSIQDSGDCGLDYTDNSDIQRMYGNLLEGSENHLRSYVGNIEAILGECSYEAQVLTQEEVDRITGSTCE